MKIQPTHSASFLYVCCIIIFTCLPRLLFAGGIKGKVTDSKGNTLPYATIYVKGTTIGTGANAEGEYFLNLGAGKYTIICQFMGFKQGEFTCTLANAATIVHDFKLPEESLDLKEVVIQSDAEDPAYAIMRKAIAKREYHLTQIKSFKTDIYLKGVIRSNKMPDKLMGKDVKLKTIPGIDSNGKGVLYLCEEEAEYYADGKKDRTIIHSVRESGNPNGFGFAQFPAVVTFYENNVNLMESSSRGYISPVSEHALFYYKYQLLGEFVENGHTVYKIKVIPRRLYEPVFNGTIYIVDDEWAIHSIDMYLTKNSNLDFMDTLGIKQLFLPLANGAWVAKNQLIYFSLNLFGFDVNGSIATVYNGQHINVALPDSIFANKLLSAYDKHANKKDTAYWSANRPIPLMADELTNYKIRDSALKVIQSERYRDSVRITRNLIKVNNLIMGNSSWSTKQYKNTFTLNPILFVASDYNESGMLNYNTEEGINFAPKIKWRHFIDTGKTLNTALAVRYGFFNTHFNSIAKIAYKQNDRTWRGRSWNIGVQGGKYVFQFNPENPVAPIFNSISTLFWRENDMKIYERYEGTGFVERNYGNGLKWDLRLAYQQRKVIHTYTDYSFFRPASSFGFTPNVPGALNNFEPWVDHSASLVHMGMSYQPGYMYVQYPEYLYGFSDWPVFTITYDKGIPGLLSSKTDFDKWRFSIEDDVKLKLLGSLEYNIAVGGFLNNKYVALPDLMHLYGNRGVGFASAYLHSFQFAQYYDWSNDEPFYTELHIEYGMLGLLSNKIPLLRQARWYFVAGTNTFYANTNDYYTEAYIGIDNLGYKLARILRIDFVQSWDSRMGRNSGIRFGIKPAGASNSHADLDKDVW